MKLERFYDYFMIVFWTFFIFLSITVVCVCLSVILLNSFEYDNCIAVAESCEEVLSCELESRFGDEKSAFENYDICLRKTEIFGKEVID